jgi:hypothetical protein
MKPTLRPFIAAVLSSLLTAFLLIGCAQPVTNSNTAQQGGAANSNATRTGTAQGKTYRVTDQGQLVDNQGTPVLDEQGNPIVLIDPQGNPIRNGQAPIIVKGGSLFVTGGGNGWEDLDSPGHYTGRFRHRDDKAKVRGGFIRYRLPDNKFEYIPIPEPHNGDILIYLDYTEAE